MRQSQPILGDDNRLIGLPNSALQSLWGRFPTDCTIMDRKRQHRIDTAWARIRFVVVYRHWSEPCNGPWSDPLLL